MVEAAGELTRSRKPCLPQMATSILVPILPALN